VRGGSVPVFPSSISGVSASRCRVATVALCLLAAVPVAARAAPSSLTFDDAQKVAQDTRCGRAEPGSEFARRLAAIAIHESGGDPLVIGVNADRARGLPAAAIRSTTPQQAAARAAALLVEGRSIDLGLMQINSGQLAQHGLTLDVAFDACRSMAAGADHYADDVRAVWSLAHRRYNTGGTERGAAYAASIERVLARVPASAATASSSLQAAAPVRVPGPLFVRAGDSSAAETPGGDQPRLFSHHGD